MANKTFGGLTATTSLADADLFAVEKSGNSRKVTAANVRGSLDWPTAWTWLTFGSSSSVYGVTAYTANETFTLGDEKSLEIESYIYRDSSTGAELYFGNLTDAYMIALQNDANVVLYKRVGGSNTSLNAVGTSTNMNKAARHRMDLFYTRAASGADMLAGEVNRLRSPANTTGLLSPNAINLTTTSISVKTSDIAKCAVRARVIG